MAARCASISAKIGSMPAAAAGSVVVAPNAAAAAAVSVARLVMVLGMVPSVVVPDRTPGATAIAMAPSLRSAVGDLDRAYREPDRQRGLQDDCGDAQVALQLRRAVHQARFGARHEPLS